MNDKLDTFLDNLQEEIFDEARGVLGEAGFERWQNPKYMGRMEKYDVHASVTGSCGDTIEMFLKFDNNLILDDITKKLDKLNYSIISQLMNYDGKVIGVEVLKDDKIVYVPTFPSAPIWDKFPLKWIDSYEGISYLETKDLLEDIYKKSEKSIPCLPVIKVIEDNLIIGIITKTNQFILVNPPIIDTFGDDLKHICPRCNFNY